MERVHVGVRSFEGRMLESEFSDFLLKHCTFGSKICDPSLKDCMLGQKFIEMPHVMVRRFRLEGFMLRSEVCLEGWMLELKDHISGCF